MTDQALANDRHRALLAQSETVPQVSRKGRRTFKVVRRHQRRMVGIDPLRDAFDSIALAEDPDAIEEASHEWVALDGQSLAAIADAWIARFHPGEVSTVHGGARECTCSDLTAPCLTLDRSDAHTPVWDAETANYVVTEVPVRACHCGWQALDGTDMGLSWSKLPPDGKRTVAYRGRNLVREAARAKRKTQGHDEHLSRAYGVPARVPTMPDPLAEVTAVLVDRLASQLGPSVEVTDFPDVTIAIRRTTGGAMNVRMTRGVESLRFTARTAGAIARRVIA